MTFMYVLYGLTYYVVATFTIAVLAYILDLAMAPGFNIKGKHVLITGGSEGLGLSFAKLSVKMGANVTIIARTQSKLDEALILLEELKISANQKILAFSCCVTDYDGLSMTIKDATERMDGQLNVVVACAGLARPKYFDESDMAMIRKQMEVNFYGSVHLAKAAQPYLIRNQSNSPKMIVFVASAVVFSATPGYTAYAASKYALKGFADSLMSEMAPQGITVHSFYPGNIETSGYNEECKEKPLATFEIEGHSTLHSPDTVAKSLLQGIQRGYYQWSNDMMCEILRINSNGMVPRRNRLVECLLWPISEIVMQVAVYVTRTTTYKYRFKTKKD